MTTMRLAPVMRLALCLSCVQLGTAYNVLTERHFARIVRSAQRDAVQEDELPLTPSYVTFTLAFNFAAHIVATNEVAFASQLPPPTLFAAGGIAANFGAVAWGVPGLLAVAAIEAWRCDGCSIEEETADEVREACALASATRADGYLPPTTSVSVHAAPLSRALCSSGRHL